MRTHRGKFRINRAEGKFFGVCAGIADHFEVDVTLIRVGMALSIIMTFPIMLFGYFLLAMIAGSDGGRGGVRREQAAAPRLSDASVEATRQRMRDLDQRMAAIETYVTSSNSQLAREIDELR